MRLLYNGNVVGTILTNHSMSIDEAIVSLEIDVYSEDYPDYDLFNVDWEDKDVSPGNTKVAYLEDYDITIVLDVNNDFLNFHYGEPSENVTPLYSNKETTLTFLEAISAKIFNI
jgi:hypothetical protein